MKTARLVDSPVMLTADRSSGGVSLVRAVRTRAKAFFSAQKDVFAAIALAEAGDPEGAVGLLDNARAGRTSVRRS